MSDTVRVYVNGRGIDVPARATALEAVRALDAAAGDAVQRGARVITDSRGLPTPPTTPMYAGAILRLVAARGRDAADDLPE